MTQRHKHIEFRSFGGPETIEVAEEAALPEPGPGEVRIRVEASSVQFTDTLIRRGVYPDVRSKPPHTPGYDFVGRVDSVGAGVTLWQPGQRVADLCVVGGNACYIIRPADQLTVVPNDLDAAEATTLVLSWMTAYQALHRVGAVRSGHKVLITGANGAVGLAAVQLALLAGAQVFATASERHHTLLHRLGATPLPRDGWLPQVEGQIDICIDGICADGYRTPLAAVKRGGTFVPIGMSALAHKKGATALAVWHYIRAVLILPWWPNGRAVNFYNIARIKKRQKAWWREDLGQLFSLLREGRIAVHVAERLRFDDVGEAHQRLESGGLQGKLVLEPWS